MTAVLTNWAQLGFRTDNLSSELTPRKSVDQLTRDLVFSKKHSCINKFGLKSLEMTRKGWELTIYFQTWHKNLKVDQCTKSQSFSDITVLLRFWDKIGFRTDNLSSECTEKC